MASVSRPYEGALSEEGVEIGVEVEALVESAACERVRGGSVVVAAWRAPLGGV